VIKTLYRIALLFCASAGIICSATVPLAVSLELSPVYAKSESGQYTDKRLIASVYIENTTNREITFSTAGYQLIREEKSGVTKITLFIPPEKTQHGKLVVRSASEFAPVLLKTSELACITCEIAAPWGRFVEVTVVVPDDVGKRYGFSAGKFSARSDLK
jgi:hypothetical protein